MARAWLKVEGALLRHPKVTRLAEMFGVHPYLIGGFLLAWWDYCAEYGRAGEAAVCPRLTLDQLALPVQKAATHLQLPDMRSALRKVRLMNRDGRPHDWQDYAGALLTRRAKEAQRKKLARLMSAGQAADAAQQKAPQSRVEKSREKLLRAQPEKSTPQRMTGADFKRALGIPAA